MKIGSCFLVYHKKSSSRNLCGMIPIQKIIGKKSDELRSGGFAGPGALNNGADITFCTVQSGIVVSGDFRIKPFCDK